MLCYVMFCPGGRNGMGCFVRGDKNCMGCFVRGGKSMWDFLSGVTKNGMGCFVPGCFVLHSFLMCPFVHLSTSSTLSLSNAYKWAFVLVGVCPSGLLSKWAFVQWAFALVGFCPSGLLS